MEAARCAESERARRQLALMTLRMEFELLSRKYDKILAGTGQRVQLTGQASRTEKLLWAATLAPDDAEAQALFAKAQELVAKDPAQRPDAAISTADSFRAFFAPSPPGQLWCLVRHRRAGRPGKRGSWAVQQERERAPLLAGERGCGIDQFADPGIQAAVRFGCGAVVVVVAFAGCGRAGVAEVAGRGRVPGWLAVPVRVFPLGC